MMKTPKDALCVEVETISDAIERGQFHLAVNAANNLTRVAYSLESISDVFLGEVMGAICGHIDFVLRSYQVSREDGEAMHAEIMRHMIELTVAHHEGQKVYHPLQEMRFVATSFVLNAEQRYPRKPQAERGGQG